MYSACTVHVQCILKMLYGVNRLQCTKLFATVTLRTYDTVHNLYFDTTFDTALDIAVSVADEATFTPVTNMTTVFDGRTVDNDFNLYFDTIFNTLPLVHDDNDNDSFCPSSTGNNERSSAAVTTKTYELLQATFILILTSIILLIVLIHISILSFG